MRAEDLISQVKRMAPRLAGQRVAFVGDHDGTSLLLGILGRMKRVSLPRQMLLLDFDQRVLASARRLARLCDFDHIFETAAYNVSEPLPDRLANQFD
jgi:predicted methyltransferase